MTNLTGDQFVQAIQSENVILRVGPDNDTFPIAKVLLAHKSDTFAKMLSKPGLTELELPKVGVALTKMFVCWCYQERLQAIDKPNAKQRKEWKDLMIDLWIFGSDYEIPKLQNEVIVQLTKLYTVPSLLEKEDLTYAWQSLPNGSGEQLKDLLVLVLVGQLEAPNATKVIEHFDDLAALEGYTTKLYKAIKLYLTFQVPVKQQNKKWVMLLQSEAVQKALKVVEKKPVIAAAGGMVGPAKRAQPNPFQPGEVIEIDD